MRISILGVDYRNAVFAGCLTFRGHQVIGFDPLQSRADWLNHSCPRGLEAGLEVLLEHGWREGLLSGTTDLAAAIRDTEITFLDGDDDAEHGMATIETLCRQIGEAIRNKPGPHCLLIRSSRSRAQVMAVMRPILEAVSGKLFGRDLHVEVSAEYMDERQVVPFWRGVSHAAGHHGSLA